MTQSSTPAVESTDGCVTRGDAATVGDDQVVTSWQAAARIGLSPSTLAKRRMSGTGPRFIRLAANRIGYRQSALDAWLAERERGSTLEA